MDKRLTVISILLSIVMLSACSTTKFPGIYTLAIEQGNIIAQKDVDQLRVGMSKTQVEYVMGQPLITPFFDQDRWDYIYTIKADDEPMQLHRLTIYFSMDAVTHVDYISS
jgi:outer membrane protein assembly factor BamE